MPLNLPTSQITAPAPIEVKPADLQPALDRLHNAFREGFINAQDIRKRTEIGNSDAEAQRRENEARKAKAEQDRKDQEGGVGYRKPFSKLARPVTPSSPVNPNAGSTEGGEEPTTLPTGALADDFNPAHESTDDLLKLVGGAGYFLP